jgi:hypothetical protein
LKPGVNCICRRRSSAVEGFALQGSAVRRSAAAAAAAADSRAMLCFIGRRNVTQRATGIRTNLIRRDVRLVTPQSIPSLSKGSSEWDIVSLRLLLNELLLTKLPIVNNASSLAWDAVHYPTAALSRCRLGNHNGTRLSHLVIGDRCIAGHGQQFCVNMKHRPNPA